MRIDLLWTSFHSASQVTGDSLWVNIIQAIPLDSLNIPHTQKGKENCKILPNLPRKTSGWSSPLNSKNATGNKRQWENSSNSTNFLVKLLCHNPLLRRPMAILAIVNFPTTQPIAWVLSLKDLCPQWVEIFGPLVKVGRKCLGNRCVCGLMFGD